MPATVVAKNPLNFQRNKFQKKSRARVPCSVAICRLISPTLVALFVEAAAASRQRLPSQDLDRISEPVLAPESPSTRIKILNPSFGSCHQHSLLHCVITIGASNTIGAPPASIITRAVQMSAAGIFKFMMFQLPSGVGTASRSMPVKPALLGPSASRTDLAVQTVKS